MLRVEYLIFIENDSIKCTDNKTFNHLLQSDPDITIARSKLTYKKFIVDYDIKSGKVKNTEKNYFHLTFSCGSTDKIDEFSSLLKAIKTVLHITNKTPQTLYDGISLYYSQLAYPLIFEIENLMRKLITKFMLTNVGIDWIKDRVPDDVKNSINAQNKDLTYLHNVDFIQLKNFLFSENYPTHKENLIQKLKQAKKVTDLNLEDIKALIPNSNWEKYFAEAVDTTKEQLSKQWDELYELRCRIAHNRSFGKSEYEKVETLCKILKDVIIKAIENLDKIDISETEKELLTETIAGNFNYSAGEFINSWGYLTRQVFELVNAKVLSVKPDALAAEKRRTFLKDLSTLFETGVMDKQTFNEIRQLANDRNQIVHSTETLTPEEISASLERVKSLGKILNGWL